MTPDPPRPLRKKIRLSPESYEQHCAYFVTVCTHEKQCLLSVIESQSVKLTKYGEIVRAVLVQLPERFSGLALDEYILMPNHLHAILCLVGAGLARPSSISAPPPTTYSLSDFLRAFKSISTIETNRAFRTPGRPLWQRSYLDHIIRDAEDMRTHQTYIIENPARWSAKKLSASPRSLTE